MRRTLAESQYHLLILSVKTCDIVASVLNFCRRFEFPEA